jgi:predicted secreted hydrolase
MAWPVAAMVLAGVAYVLWPRPAVHATTGVDPAALIASVESLSADQTAGATPAGSITFPQDLGAHPDALTELWDLTADLRGSGELKLAVRLTLVRFRLDAAGGTGRSAVGGQSAALEAAESGSPGRASRLAAKHVLAGSLVVTADQPGLSARAQRLSRAALGLAGVDIGPEGTGRVWLEDWELTRDDEGHLSLTATAEEARLMLTLIPSKPPVVLDQAALTGAGEPRNATMQVYSQSRLAVAGTLHADGVDHVLHGSAWLDHGWGALAAAISGQRGQLVGNRFQLQLDNGIELSCLHLRRRAGGGTPVSRCALITVDSELVALDRRDVTLEPLEDGWDVQNGVRYPLRWRLLIPARGLELEIERGLEQGVAESLSPVAGSAASWAIAVEVHGWRESDAIRGVGRMDLNGYGAAPPSGT